MKSGFFYQIGNGEAVRLNQIPHLSFEDFRSEVLYLVSNGGQVVHFFAYAERMARAKFMAVIRQDRLLLTGTCDAPDTYTSFTTQCEPFHMFEREIAEQFGIRPEGHPWLKMVRYHPNERDVADVFGNDYTQDIPGNYHYYSVSGQEIHEVAVGPVHAGVIEPGHFRFNCVGERVLNLEIQLGYQHRGVERLLRDVSLERLPVIAESIAGDTSVGNSLCMAQAFEALAGVETDPGARIIRTIALELERIANHVGDLGALSGDVAFLPPANYCGRMRGDFLNMTLWICGNRFGKGLVRPGGVRFPVTDDDRKVLSERLNVLETEVSHVIDLLFSTPSVRARFEGCGAVSTSDAKALGLVGPAGRACAMAYDVRRDFPTEHYRQSGIPENIQTSGDVYARARIRADEVMQSIKLIQSLLNLNIKTDCVDGISMFTPAPASMVVTLNEAWRGELSHCVITDADGNILRYKVKDPSFHNWSGLAMSLRNTGISDFPLNNKSYNLSYCGFDL